MCILCEGRWAKSNRVTLNAQLETGVLLTTLPISRAKFQISYLRYYFYL